MAKWFVAVDGGGTKCTVRVEDERGSLLGRVVTGPANVRLSVANTWSEILLALEKILAPHAMALTDERHEFHVAMGLAGCEIKPAYDRFINTPHRFKTLIVTSDAEIACLGAHAGANGAILIVGTGVVGFKKEGDAIMKMSGYGFPHDDRGGGAYIGLEAMNYALCVKDKIMTPGMLSYQLHAKFGRDWDALIAWANQANATVFATLAPLVIDCAKAGDPQAITLMQQAAAYLDRLLSVLLPEKTVPLALVGGIATAIQPYLHSAWQRHIRDALMLPDEGAMTLIRQKVAAHDAD